MHASYDAMQKRGIHNEQQATYICCKPKTNKQTNKQKNKNKNNYPGTKNNIIFKLNKKNPGNTPGIMDNDTGGNYTNNFFLKKTTNVPT